MNGMSLSGKVELINQKAKFRCSVEGHDNLIVDYIPPLGNSEGYTSLELLYAEPWELFCKYCKICT